MRFDNNQISHIDLLNVGAQTHNKLQLRINAIKNQINIQNKINNIKRQQIISNIMNNQIKQISENKQENIDTNVVENVSEHIGMILTEIPQINKKHNNIEGNINVQVIKKNKNKHFEEESNTIAILNRDNECHTQKDKSDKHKSISNITVNTIKNKNKHM